VRFSGAAVAGGTPVAASPIAAPLTPTPTKPLAVTAPASH
jgi:hypothetical protein